MLSKIKLAKSQLLITYKLLIDALFIFSVFFLLALFGEGLLPGIVSSHVGFSKIIFFIGLALYLAYLTANLAGIKLKDIAPNKKTAIALFLVSILLVFNSLLKLNIFLNLFILVLIVFSGYFVYKVTLEE